MSTRGRLIEEGRFAPPSAYSSVRWDARLQEASEREITIAGWRCGLDEPIDSPGIFNYEGVPEWWPQEAKDCIKVHEEAHAAFRMPCCKKARAALQAPGADRAKVIDAWNAFLRETTDFSECEAEKAELRCYEEKTGKLKCGCKDGPKPPSEAYEACYTLEQERDDSYEEVNGDNGPCSAVKGRTMPDCPAFE